VNVYRLLGAIFLGVGSDDGNLLVLRPKGWTKPSARKPKAKAKVKAKAKTKTKAKTKATKKKGKK
jgi:hypothetical protein